MPWSRWVSSSVPVPSNSQALGRERFGERVVLVVAVAYKHPDDPLSGSAGTGPRQIVSSPFLPTPITTASSPEVQNALLSATMRTPAPYMLECANGG